MNNKMKTIPMMVPIPIVPALLPPSATTTSATGTQRPTIRMQNPSLRPIMGQNSAIRSASIQNSAIRSNTMHNSAIRSAPIQNSAIRSAAVQHSARSVTVQSPVVRAVTGQNSMVRPVRMQAQTPTQKVATTQSIPMRVVSAQSATITKPVTQNAPTSSPVPIQNTNTSKPTVTQNTPPAKPVALQNTTTKKPVVIQNVPIQNASAACVAQNNPIQNAVVLQISPLQTPASIRNTPSQSPVPIQNTHMQLPAPIQNTQIQIPTSIQNQVHQNQLPIENVHLQLATSIHNTPIQIPVSIQNTPNPAAIHHMPIQIPISIQNSPMQIPVSIHNAPLQNLVAMQNMPMQNLVTLQNTPLQNLVTIQNTPQQSPGAIQSTPIQSPITIHSTPAQSPITIQNTTMQTPVAIQNAPIQIPVTMQSTPVQAQTPVTIQNPPLPKPISACWLCGAMKSEGTGVKDKKFISIWGSAETILKKQRAAKILLAEDGKGDKLFAEGDSICQTCGSQINRRICIMEGKPFGSAPKKQKPTKHAKGKKWISDDTSDDDISILDSNSSSVGFIGSKRRPTPAKKRKLSETPGTVNKKSPVVKATKTGRTVKAPDRFTGQPDPDKQKRSQNKVVHSKSKPVGQAQLPGEHHNVHNNFFHTIPSSPPKIKTSSVSSLNLSSIFGEDDSIFVEVCIDNVASAIAAFKGGARRIELCSSLSEGGLTPSCGFLREVKSLVKIPVFAMIRPRGGDFLYSDGEIDVMKYDIKNYKHNGADGFVFGVLDKNGFVDIAKCRALLQAADPLPCTFHRAFDYVNDPLTSIETVIKLGFTRILTSGQKPTAAEGVPLLKKLVEKAAGRISIMAGAGINPNCVGNIVARTGVREVHGSARVLIQSPMKQGNGSQVSMGQNPADDFSLFVTDANAVAQIVKAAEDALEAGKLITIL